MGFLFGSPSQQTSTSSNSLVSGNLAYPTVANSTAPSLGLASDAGNMMASLLGIPGFGTNPSNPAPTSLAPGATVGGNPSPVTSSVGPSFSSPSFMNTILPSSPIGSPKSMNGAPIGMEDLNNSFGSNDGSIGGHIARTIDGINNGSIPDTGAVFGAPGGPTGGPLGVGVPNPVTTPFNPGTPPIVTGGGLPVTNPVSGTPTPVSGTAPSAGSALDDFSNSAGMDFIRSQGVKAIDASQAGKGMLNSGATGQALSDYGTNLGKTYLNNYLQDLGSLAGIGQNQTNSLVDAGRTMASSGTSSGSGTGAKPGLLQTIAGNPGVPAAIAAAA